MARDKAGCATLQRSAALVKFSVSLTAKKYRIWCISKVRRSLRSHARHCRARGVHSGASVRAIERFDQARGYYAPTTTVVQSATPRELNEFRQSDYYAPTETQKILIMRSLIRHPLS
jgi:hypothetical protein